MNQTRPAHTRQAKTNPAHTQTRPDQTGQDQTTPDYTRPTQPRPHRTSPHQTTPDHTRPAQPTPVLISVSLIFCDGCSDGQVWDLHIKKTAGIKRNSYVDIFYALCPACTNIHRIFFPLSHYRLNTECVAIRFVVSSCAVHARKRFLNQHFIWRDCYS